MQVIIGCLVGSIVSISVVSRATTLSQVASPNLCLCQSFHGPGSFSSRSDCPGGVRSCLGRHVWRVCAGCPVCCG